MFKEDENTESSIFLETFDGDTTQLQHIFDGKADTVEKQDDQAVEEVEQTPEEIAEEYNKYSPWGKEGPKLNMEKSEPQYEEIHVAKQDTVDTAQEEDKAPSENGTQVTGKNEVGFIQYGRGDVPGDEQSTSTQAVMERMGIDTNDPHYTDYEVSTYYDLGIGEEPKAPAHIGESDAKQRYEGLVSMLLAMLSLVLCCAPTLILQLASLGIGIYAICTRKKRSNNDLGMGIAGVVISGLGISWSIAGGLAYLLPYFVLI